MLLGALILILIGYLFGAFCYGDEGAYWFIFCLIIVSILVTGAYTAGRDSMKPIQAEAIK